MWQSNRIRFQYGKPSVEGVDEGWLEQPHLAESVWWTATSSIETSGWQSFINVRSLGTILLAIKTRLYSAPRGRSVAGPWLKSSLHNHISSAITHNPFFLHNQNQNNTRRSGHFKEYVDRIVCIHTQLYCGDRQKQRRDNLSMTLLNRSRSTPKPNVTEELRWPTVFTHSLSKTSKPDGNTSTTNSSGINIQQT